MNLLRRLIRAALLSATLALLVLTRGPSAFAKPAPPETPVGALVRDPAVSPPLSVSAEVSGTSSLWQLVLVAALSAVAAVLVTLIAIRLAGKRRTIGSLVVP